MSDDASSAPEPVVLPADRPLDYVLSSALWAAGVAWLVPMMGLQMALHRLLGPERMQWLERIYTRGQVALTGSRWRAVVHPDIDPRRPYLFFQNHVNHLDHCTAYAATPHFKQGVELEDHFRYPVYGPYMRSRGTIPVARGSLRGLAELMRRMRDEVQRGHSLLIFPEGTRTLTGHLGELQPGVFRIAVQLGVPIVPVTVTGMYRVMRKGSYLIRPGHEVTVYCDAPIETAGLTRRDVPALMAQVREVMERRLEAYWEGRPQPPMAGIPETPAS
ncbi:MAG: lysophospholipid acyltransferase family protein [Myxococcales bacterium]|jgi:1-acyl-sn-glycerol-3-phosphate acyltransferase